MPIGAFADVVAEEAAEDSLPSIKRLLREVFQAVIVPGCFDWLEGVWGCFGVACMAAFVVILLVVGRQRCANALGDGMMLVNLCGDI